MYATLHAAILWYQLNVLLISTYELGHHPFGLASAKAWLARDGHHVESADLSVDRLPDPSQAELVAFYLPMHTATRLALPVIERIRRLNPRARLAAFGLYASLNAELLRSAGVTAIAGGEFEPALCAIAAGGEVPEISLDRLQFIVPDRSGASTNYARLVHRGESARVAYTEASRGCKHTCRHCPIVPVYRGQFRVVQREVVLEDIRNQAALGATHVTFGDPDFFNGPTHAMKIVEAMHHEFPALTYDATIKIEHLLKHRDLLTILRDTGCLMVTSAVESLDDAVLLKLEKHHTRRDFFEAADLLRTAGLTLQPTFIAFTPWTTQAAYRDLLRSLAALELVENVAPVQLALRLLITPGSLLLDLEEIRAAIGPFDAKALIYPWKHRDAQMDALGHRIFQLVRDRAGLARTEVFQEIATLAGLDNFKLLPRAAVPYLNEPWYC
jgi:radical SAM superfamily enzyme YgiQ (UPF0313 family)